MNLFGIFVNLSTSGIIHDILFLMSKSHLLKEQRWRIDDRSFAIFPITLIFFLQHAAVQLFRQVDLENQILTPLSYTGLED